MAEEEKIRTESRRNWSELRLELLELILKRLALVDMARFKLVSKSWYAAAKSYISSPVTYKPLVPQAPWLLLPRRRSDGDDGRFFSLSEKKVYIFRNLFEGFGDHELLGSSHGWLVMWDSNLLRIHLFNPISRVRILLPPLGFQGILSAFLSSDPSCNSTFYVVVVYTEKEDTRIAFHKHSDDQNNTATWTDLDSVDGGFGEIFFHHSLLLGMSLDSNSIRVCDFGATTSRIKTIDFQPPERDAEQLNYGRLFGGITR
ncbi:PREDICTED: putative F-box protein At4g22660 [Fragaria vesca subsp. vesca]|uniref:putative F-box protein At4g22660 n=1 Tax=Fragaria vesca subsp. vesca TaxID=101020 RepID=UPI0002C34DA1|nr:PREDICTED: putative F-box protein At4g22660 [Fragaria vesca subsp. vesca]